LPVTQKSKLFDEDLVDALSHPTRAHAFAVFTERPASTREIADEVNEDVSRVHHHVRKLVKLGCIEEVRSERRRGATERFYRATIRHYFDPDSWATVPEKNRLDISMAVLKLISADLTEALLAGSIDAVDRHLSRTRFNTDEKGFAEVHKLLDQTLEGLLRIREESVGRLAKSDEGAMQATVSMMQFELPLPG
jgi:predicted ArsR family transcriptional regulator